MCIVPWILLVSKCVLGFFVVFFPFLKIIFAPLPVKGLNGTCDETNTGLHPHQPAAQITTVSRELSKRNTQMVTHSACWCGLIRTMIIVKWHTKQQRGESNMCSYCVYLGNLQQYNTVLDGLYHTLKEKNKEEFIHWKLTAKLRNRKEKVSLTQVVSFNFSIFCKKEKQIQPSQRHLFKRFKSK